MQTSAGDFYVHFTLCEEQKEMNILTISCAVGGEGETKQYLERGPSLLKANPTKKPLCQ